MVETVNTVPDESEATNWRLIAILGAAAVVFVLILLAIFTGGRDAPPPAPRAAQQQAPRPAPLTEYDPAVESLKDLANARPVPTTVTVRGEGEVAVAAMLTQIGTMIGDPVELRTIVVQRMMGDHFTIGSGPAETLVNTNFGERAPVKQGDIVTITGIVRNIGALSDETGVPEKFLAKARAYIELNEVTVYGPVPEPSASPDDAGA